MSNVLPFEASTHKVVDVLLPWLVNGTLDGEERELVERHLARCERCRREVEWLRELQAACVAAPAAQKLRERLTRVPANARWRRRWQSMQPWTRAVMAAQLAAILVLGAFVAIPQADAPYRTLGASESPARAGASLVVVFDPAITEAELRGTLRAVGARIVDGPTQANAYLVDVPPAGKAQAMRELKADRRVMLVESLGAGNAR
jgi:anti-sigma factor RsiW